MMMYYYGTVSRIKTYSSGCYLQERLYGHSQQVRYLSFRFVGTKRYFLKQFSVSLLTLRVTPTSDTVASFLQLQYEPILWEMDFGTLSMKISLSTC